MAVDIEAPAGAWVKEEYKGEDPEQIIAFLSSQETRERTAASHAQDLADELAKEAEAGVVPNSAYPVMRSGPQRPPGVWTLDQMDLGKPVEAVLVLEGRPFTFHFWPILNRDDIQERFLKASGKDITTGKDWLKLGQDYAAVLRECLVDWPLMEEVDDPETGDPMVDAETGYIMMRPLPITLANIKRLKTEIKVEFFLSMRAALRGEVNGKPSPTA